ncbi:MAG: tRNA1(Val) (adenine(37)-N6)-methyltransferase [Clostridia bacterium]|nr:tRNA1(Val) (adenine(37)-N6)-methyltransferase [Clostridia bacterium]MBR3152228.1 tRNA1(Val) (adenine(37)-N6)-methyltransferase [Clostridia bacterium]MBR3152235.1 tRNA1(Val) (adenine(37)-N6)-methyltransferase [Clostridia bacterium]
MDIILNENERIDDLEWKDLKIIQNSEWFCFGIDSVLISDFAKDIKKGSIVADFGSGTGIISILLSKKIEPKKILEFEIQKDVAEMAQKSIELNNLENIIEVKNINLKEIGKHFEKNYFDAIVTNPPYKKLNTGLINDSENKLISRHEIMCSLDEWIKTSFDMLKDKGEFYMVHRPDRLVDIINCMRQNKIEPKIIRFVYPKINKKPNLVLIKGVKNGRSSVTIKEPLVVYEENGEYTNEILEIYHKKKGN